jgi:3-hydroxyisobutyrate dehydrogenase-like beta-hydroxyacid dehydrogenase
MSESLPWPYKRDMIVSGDYRPAFTVEQMIKDFNIIIDTARTDHVPVFVAALVRQQYEVARVEGNAGRDYFVLCEGASRGSAASPS